MGRPRKGISDDFGRECTKCGFYKLWIEFKCPSSTYSPIWCLECVRKQKYLRSASGHPVAKPQALTQIYKREKHSWSAMKQRCSNPKFPSFEYYGGRGIRVCSGLSRFANFLSVLGPRPILLTLDRKDNDGNYSCGACDECRNNNWPLNVRWATWSEQNKNKRSSLYICS